MIKTGTGERQRVRLKAPVCTCGGIIPGRARSDQKRPTRPVQVVKRHGRMFVCHACGARRPRKDLIQP